MKKITCLFLALLLASMSGCGGSSSSGDTTAADTTTEAPEVTTSILDTMEAKDFGGATYTILDANDYPDSHINMPGEEQNGDIVNDGLIARDRKVAEKFNVNIEYVQMTNATVGTDALRQSVMAGEEVYNLCISTVSGGRLATLASENLLANLCETPHLQLDQGWWSKLMYDNLQLGGRMYYTTGDISPCMYTTALITYMNKNLLEEYQIDTDFYQLVRDGKWTVDALISAVKPFDNDLNSDGVMHASDDFFGIVHTINELTASALFIGCGISTCDVGDDGTLSVNLASEQSVAVAEKLRQLVSTIKYDNQNDMHAVTFTGDRAMACIQTVTCAKGDAFRSMESDYMVLPMPKYDEKQETYRCLVNGWTDCYIGIPKTADPELSGFVTEALSVEAYTSMRPQIINDLILQKALRDEESGEMLEIIWDSLYLDFNNVNNFANTLPMLKSVLWDGAELTTRMAALSTAVESKIASFTESWMAD